MSLYPQQQDRTASNTNGGLSQNQLAGGPSDLSLLDQNAGLMGGLDMDLALPMELDMDLANTAAAGPGIDPRTFHVANHMSQQPQDLDMGATSLGSANGAYGQPSGLPSQREQQQQQQQQYHQMQETAREQMQLQQDQLDAARGGAGAGPLPAGFGLMQPPSTGSTLTEFTKRRNWSQRIIEELRDLLHILTPDGQILYMSPSCKTITGHEPTDLIGKFMGEYVHPDDSGIFMREFNESIASGNPLRFFYRFKKEDGEFMIFECDGHPHISTGDGGSQPLGYGQSPVQQIPNHQPGVCRGFFMMARPYPTKNAALLDSFLEHKIENERLSKRIEELKREEADDTAEQERLYLDQISGMRGAASASTTPAHTQDKSQEPTPNYQGMPPPAKPSISNIALTRQNLDSVLSAQKPDSIADKMSRYEANSNHLESIEMLTGLKYRDGERSHGISTGDTSPALIRGDAGIAILMDRDRDGAKKEKKKVKIVDEYVCSDCGTLDSPEWRKGPKGPKTLCNACGLRWAKKEKKRGGGDDSTDLTPTSVTGYGQSGGRLVMPPPPIGLLQQHSSGSMSQ